MGSVGVAVRSAVMTGLEAALTVDGEVTYGYTFSPQILEHVYSGRSFGDTPPASLRAGRNYRNESGTFEINVLVYKPGGSLLDADERADELQGDIEDWIADRKNNELGVTGLSSIIVTRWAADYFQTDNGMASLRTITVAWTARLT